MVQAVGGVTELYGIPGVGTFEAGKANLATFFETTKEVGEGAMKAFERGIDENRRQIRVRLFAMMFVLLVEMHVFACLFVVRDQFLQAGIIHLTRGNKRPHQGLFLCLRGTKSVLKRSHGSSIACFDSVVKRQGSSQKRLTPGAEAPELAAGLSPSMSELPLLRGR